MSLAQPQALIESVESDTSPAVPRRAAWKTVWYLSHVLLLISLAWAAYSLAWEYSTRSYLRGFSDAVIPASAAPLGKINAILKWMSYGPAREQSLPDDMFPDRDPSDTLNYTSLLRTCGSATNAFINLADTAGLSARRLLLRNSDGQVMHVVAEVLVDGRWIVVDPAFRSIMKGPGGQPLTREQLADPATLAAATGALHGYLADYNFRNTTHLHLARLPAGNMLARLLGHLFPGWDASAFVSLMVERSSLAAAVISISVAVLLGFLRILLVFLRRRERFARSAAVA